jgi:hypothetical protein
VFLILALACLLFLFTSSRFTLLAAAIIAMFFRFGRSGAAPNRQGRGWALFRQVLFAALLLLIFMGGVWLRSIATWRDTSNPWSVLLGPLYETTAYVVSPVNYSFAFIAEGVAFARGLSLDHFFSFIYTVLNAPEDNTFRDLIAWNYNPSLSLIGLVGEWYTITGPLLWLPALMYGFIAGATFERFRCGSLAGTLLYPIVLVSIYDSLRGFALPLNLLAANILYLGFGVVVALFSRSRAVLRDTRSPHLVHS